MKKVSILFIILTIILTTIDKKDLKDFFSMFVIFGVSYLFAYYIIDKIHYYNRIRRLENEINENFTDEFFSRLKIDLDSIKRKNELRKISCSKLYPIQSDEKLQ